MVKWSGFACSPPQEPTALRQGQGWQFQKEKKKVKVGPSGTTPISREFPRNQQGSAF